MKSRQILQINFLTSLLFTILLFLALRVIGFDGLYGQDAYEYLRYTRELLSFYRDGLDPGDYFWPIYYPFLGSIISFISGNEIIVLQLISILSISITTFYLRKMLFLLYVKPLYVDAYVIIFFLFAPYVLRLGGSIMSDSLAMCFTFLTFYHGIKYSKNRKITSFYLSAIFAISAIMTRYATGVVLVPLGLYILRTIFFKNKSHRYHIVCVLLIMCILTLPHLYIRGYESLKFLEHDAITKSNLLNLFSRKFIDNDGFHSFTFPNIIYSFFNIVHPAYLFSGLPLLLFLRKNDFKIPLYLLLWTSIVLYAIFIGCIALQNKRFLLLTFPLVIVVLYPAFRRGIEKIRLAKTILIIAFIFQLGLITKSMQPIIKRVNFENEVFNKMKVYEGRKLYSFDIDIALQGRGLNFEYKNLYLNKYTNFDVNDLVLFHPTKFTEQWKGKNPMINWDYLNDNHNLIILEQLTDGWLLYEVKE